MILGVGASSSFGDVVGTVGGTIELSSGMRLGVGSLLSVGEFLCLVWETTLGSGLVHISGRFGILSALLSIFTIYKMAFCTSSPDDNEGTVFDGGFVRIATISSADCLR